MEPAIFRSSPSNDALVVYLTYNPQKAFQCFPAWCLLYFVLLLPNCDIETINQNKWAHRTTWIFQPPPFNDRYHTTQLMCCWMGIHKPPPKYARKTNCTKGEETTFLPLIIAACHLWTTVHIPITDHNHTEISSHYPPLLAYLSSQISSFVLLIVLHSHSTKAFINGWMTLRSQKSSRWGNPTFDPPQANPGTEISTNRYINMII